MISISAARKLTGSYLKNQTDEQIQNLLNQLYGLADLVTDQVLTPGSNENPAVIDSSIREGQNGN